MSKLLWVRDPLQLFSSWPFAEVLTVPSVEPHCATGHFQGQTSACPVICIRTSAYRVFVGRVLLHETNKFIHVPIIHAARAIDKYFELRQASEVHSAGPAAAEDGMESAVDPRLEDIVDRMLARCIKDQQYEQVPYLTTHDRVSDPADSCCS